jgi:hypothetical protein
MTINQLMKYKMLVFSHNNLTKCKQNDTVSNSIVSFDFGILHWVILDYRITEYTSMSNVLSV